MGGELQLAAALLPPAACQQVACNCLPDAAQKARAAAVWWLLRCPCRHSCLGALNWLAGALGGGRYARGAGRRAAALPPLHLRVLRALWRPRPGVPRCACLGAPGEVRPLTCCALAGAGTPPALRPPFLLSRRRPHSCRTAPTPCPAVDLLPSSVSLRILWELPRGIQARVLWAAARRKHPEPIVAGAPCLRSLRRWCRPVQVAAAGRSPAPLPACLPWAPPSQAALWAHPPPPASTAAAGAVADPEVLGYLKLYALLLDRAQVRRAGGLRASQDLPRPRCLGALLRCAPWPHCQLASQGMQPRGGP